MTTPDSVGKRGKRGALLTIVVGAGLAMLAWSQVWFSFELTLGAQAYSGEARGDVAAPAVMALALAALAVLAALALAGVVFRYVLGALLALVGAVLVLQSYVAVANPVPAIAPEVTAASGLAGEQTIADAVAAGTVSVTFSPLRVSSRSSRRAGGRRAGVASRQPPSSPWTSSRSRATRRMHRPPAPGRTAIGASSSGMR